MGGPLRYAHVSTPIGTFRVVFRDRTLVVVDLLERGLSESGIPEGAVEARGRLPADSPPAQLKEYFRNPRKSFEFELADDAGTDFDRAIWKELRKVPAGSTVSYGELARRAGYPGAARAVGGAMRRNPVPIFVPCHRVVGDDRSLTGFGLGLWRKRWLLAHEGAWPLKDGTPEGPHDRLQRTLDQVVGALEPPAARRRAAQPA